MNQAIVMDIQRFSIHDGPGIRTTVFLKGCHLHCQWCHNPESQLPFPELMFYQRQCIGCGACTVLCRRNAHRIENITDQGKRKTIHTICLDCCRGCENMERCTAACPSQAIRLVGKRMSADEVMTELRKDKDFYRQGGGVTFSGGEPLLQLPFLKEILPMCRKEGLHVCMDTTLEIPWEQLKEAADETDLFLVDCKVLDPRRAVVYQGRAYQYMPENLRRLSERNIPVILRVPIAAGVNDTPEETQERRRLVEGLGNIIRVDTFPVSSHGRSKYEALQRRMGWKEEK